MSAPKKAVEPEHALLSASAAHRWLICTPAPRLEETLPESSSEYADEGRLAHAIAELKLRKYIEPMSLKSFNAKLKKLEADPLYKPEMANTTDVYLDYIKGLSISLESKPYIAAEQKVFYSTYAPEGFGTADNIIIHGNTLRVNDYKHGQGVPVSAVDNPQMKLYALGAYERYSAFWAFPIEKVILAIIQPRLDSISEWEISIEDLLAWGESIKPIAQKAFMGLGDYIPGEHCQFCRARATCRVRSDNYLALETEYLLQKPPLISNEEVGSILARARDLAKWVKHLEEYALTQLLIGNEVPGWKAVAGRSVRQFNDQDSAFQVLKASGIDEAMLYERKPLTLTATEDLVGKAKFKELLSEYIIQPPGKPALAPLSDKREPIQARSAKDDFGGVVNE